VINQNSSSGISQAVLRIRDPVLFLNPGSGSYRGFQITNPVVTIFGVKNTLIFFIGRKLFSVPTKKLNNFQFMASEKDRTTNFPLPLFCCCGIQDGKIRNRKGRKGEIRILVFVRDPK
jgi:hypothetical protein